MVQFTTLKLQGFKSFVESTELDIGTGLNGIVGPNGCGKSNLVEALRWVMGESSAKKMRSGSMDDVIFAGTKNRPARTNAQVTLTLSNDMRDAPAPFQDVDTLEITRRIERDAGSVYKVNGKSVRARDVQMLFADTVSGANSAALISQGRVNEIITSKPTQRRQILEESAGISGLYARRHEAELRLKAAESNLIRLDDILGETQTRLNSLKKQARQAIKYKNITNHIKDLEALIAWLEWRQSADKLSVSKQEFKEIEAHVREKMVGVSELTREEAEKSENLPNLRQEEAKASAALQSHRLKAQKIEDDKSRIETEINRLKADIEQAKQDFTHEKEDVGVQTAQLEKLEVERSALQNQMAGPDLSEEKLKVKTDIASKLEALEQRLQALQLAQAEHIALQRNAQSSHESALRSVENWKSEVERLGAKIVSHEHNQPHQKEISALSAKISETESLLEELKANRADLHNTLETEEAALVTQQDKVNSIQEKISINTNEANVLRSFLNSKNEENRVLDLVKPEKGIEIALAKSLGEALTDSLDQWHESISVDQALPEGVESISGKVKAPKSLAAALSQIGLVENEDDAKTKFSQLKPGQILVTKSGAVFRWDGYFIPAKTQSQAAKELENQNRIEALQAEREVLEKEHVGSSQKLEALKLKVQDIKCSIKEHHAQVNEVETNLQDLRSQQQSLKDQIQDWQNEKTRLDERLSQSKAMLESAQSDLKEAKEGLAKAETDNEDDTVLDDIKGEIASTKLSLDEASQDHQHYLYQRSHQQVRLNNLHADIERIEARLSKTDDRLQVFLKRQEIAKAELQKLEGMPEKLEAQHQDLQSNLVELEKVKSDASDALSLIEEEYRVLKARLKEAEEDLIQAREKRSAIQSSMSALQAQEEMGRSAIQNTFKMTPEGLRTHLEITEETDLPNLGEAKEKREKLILDRDRIGAVNLRAQEEVDQEFKEFEALNLEKEDLIQAIEKLRHGISKLNREARQKLKFAFTQVNDHFKTLFSRLYNGGEAYLEMVESDDVLDAGLEIFAQPPGKKLQSLSLLSGGEQTLASIALIFAMFLTNPSPICVLDEIDAPLDDANVDRVCTLLEEISAKGDTRFLVVTHHRMTMARMDRLYGVTMAEKGVSQLVSVDLEVQGDLLLESAAA